MASMQASNMITDSHSSRAQALADSLRLAVGRQGEKEEPQIPKIIYASRTHSQLAQVISELKNTSYRPKICILGSREQLCVHPDVKKLASTTAKNTVCHRKVVHKTCTFYQQVSTASAKTEFSGGIMDLEDIVTYSMQHKFFAIDL